MSKRRMNVTHKEGVSFGVLPTRYVAIAVGAIDTAIGDDGVERETDETYHDFYEVIGVAQERVTNYTIVSEYFDISVMPTHEMMEEKGWSPTDHFTTLEFVVINGEHASTIPDLKEEHGYDVCAVCPAPWDPSEDGERFREKIEKLGVEAVGKKKHRNAMRREREEKKG